MKSSQRRKPANSTADLTKKALEELVSKAKVDIEAAERSLKEPLNKTREDIELSEKAAEGPLGKANEDAKAPRCPLRSHVGCPVSVAGTKDKALEEVLCKAREESRLARKALAQAQKENALVEEDAITAIKGLEEALSKAREENRLAREALSEVQKKTRLAVEDTTLTKEALEEALTEANPMQPQYMSSILHKLCTPLHSIIGFSKLLLDSKVADVETQKEFLTIINQQSEHLCSLITELTEVSNIEPARLASGKKLRR